MKRLFAIFIVLCLALSVCIAVSADDQAQYTYSTDANSGIRHEVCTTLLGTSASAYYTGSYRYENLSGLDSDDLLSALRTLMTNTHTTNSSYANCRDMAVLTDCENADGTSISLLYTSYSSSWADWITNNSQGWNREHVWPQSLGNFGTSGPGADLHHVRPSDQTVNGTRGNLKYGNVTGGTAVRGTSITQNALGGYKSSTYFEPLDNVKGDVARICLYMYVRYGGMSNYNCNSITNVFESVDVLLDWCALDPVDTWEMGRNEVVAAYQGNRNVFIDYPELAWLLFDEEIPCTLTTPSGKVFHSYEAVVTAPTCTEQGYTTYTCSGCGDSYIDSYVEPLGHDYGEWYVTVPVECLTDGQERHDCSRCDHNETRVVEKLGHDLIHHEAQDATCTEIGWDAYDTCSRCDYTTYVEIPATGHSYEAVVTDPTCTEQGYTTHTCSACGDSYTDSYLPALGHTVENGSCCNCDAVFIAITSDLEDTYVSSGKKATVTVEAEGEGLSYAWYYRDGSSGAFKLTTSFTGNSYSVTMNASRSGRQVYCVITDSNGFSAQTATVTLGMKATIITQPKSASVKSKETITVSLEAAGDGLTYTWYYSDDGGLNFRKTTSFTGNSYSITMTSARAGRKVYCVVTDKFGNSVTSKTVTLGMRGTAAIRTQPVSVTVASGETAKVAVRASGTGLTYEWYFSDNGGLSFSKTTAFTGNSYSIKMTSARAGRQVYCVVTDKNGNSVQTDTVTLGMTGKAAIRTQPVSVTVANGETAMVAVRASGTGLTYTWFYSDDGGKTFKVTTAFTGSTYSVTMNAKRAGRMVYCVITDANGNKVTTDVVTLNMG